MKINHFVDVWDKDGLQNWPNILVDSGIIVCHLVTLTFTLLRISCSTKVRLMKIDSITQFIIPQQAGILLINLQLATLLTSEILLDIESLADVLNIFSIQMLNENIDYMLMMQNTIIFLWRFCDCDDWKWTWCKQESNNIQNEIRRTTLIYLIAVFFFG